MTEQRFATWVQPLAARDRESREQAARFARTLGDVLSAPGGDPGWTVRDELAHMAASDGDFIEMLGAIVRGKTPDTSVFADIDARNAKNLAAWKDRSPEQIADALDESGRQIGDLLARLTEGDADRNPDGVPFPMSALIGGYSQHHAYHVGQVREAVSKARQGAG